MIVRLKNYILKTVDVFVMPVSDFGHILQFCVQCIYFISLRHVRFLILYFLF